MFKSIMAILGVFVLIMLPAMAMAQPGNKGHGDRQGAVNVPTPSPSAYEHSDEKAKFQRETHDMGKHEGQETQKGEDKVKPKDYDQETGKDKKKGEKGKTKSKDDTAEEIEKPSIDKAKGKGKVKESGTETAADKLLEKGHKTKQEKDK